MEKPAPQTFTLREANAAGDDRRTGRVCWMILRDGHRYDGFLTLGAALRRLVELRRANEQV